MTRTPAATTAFVGLGSNLGASPAILASARAALDRLPQTAVTASSSLYQSAPLGGPPGQGDYINAVVQLATGLEPLALLDALLELETAAGRVRTVRWGPRTLDLDLLLYADLVLDAGRLILPHPRLHERAFVLTPLCEIAPNLFHPRLQQQVCRLAAAPGLPTLTLFSREW